MKTEPQWFQRVATLFAGLLLGGVIGSALITSAFTGPSLAPPNGYGVFVNGSSNNIAIGTTTIANATKFLVVGSSTSASEYAFQVMPRTGNAIMTLRNDGRVGFGLTNPSVDFHIFKNSPTVSIDSVGATQDVTLYFQQTGTLRGNIRYDNTNGGLGLGDSVLNRFFIKNGGNIGVSTTNPGYKLDVQGGDINVSGVYRSAGSAGISIGCASGYVLASTTVVGGIITGGSCIQIGGGATYQ